MNRIKKLLEKGYFPSQLPPPFTTSQFAEAHENLKIQWVKRSNRIPDTKGEHFSVARAGHTRRSITIPNPINQFYIVQEIDAHWDKLEKHFKKSRLSLSVPRFKPDTERATKILPLSELNEKKLTLSAGYEFVLKTDISRFFPTLYTHSIPWALHSKAVAKKNRSFDKKYYGNRIDATVRKSQDGQTIGIAIGPDTSHIISEIIATAIDHLIWKQLKTKPTGYRHVDDYFLCFNSRTEAENALTVISKALREYELDINAAKTHILKVEDVEEDGWVHRIRSFQIFREGIEQRRDLHNFFSTSFEMAKSYKDENVIKYAIKRISGQLIERSNWDIYEAYLLKCGLSFPNTLQSITNIILSYLSIGYQISAKKLKNFCENIIIGAAPIEHHSEVAWALWLAKELDIKLSVRAGKALEGINSGVCALLTLDCIDKNILQKKVDTEYWSSFMDANGLHGNMWLLVYEAALNKWLPEKEVGFLTSDRHFSVLYEQSISFYDQKAKTKPLMKIIEVDEFGEEEIEFEDVPELYA